MCRLHSNLYSPHHERADVLRDPARLARRHGGASQRVQQRCVAAQVAHLKANGETRKPYVLGSKGCFKLVQPHRRLPVVHVVALQVEFERHILKPVFHLIGYRLWV